MEWRADEERGGWERALRYAGGAVAGLAALLFFGSIFFRAGLTEAAVRFFASSGFSGRPRRVLRVWDWWSPATSEKYAAYFGEVKREFERAHPDVEVVYQYVPFGQYEQKMATGLVGNAPPDVFQSSVSWAEGFYDRGMLLRLNPFLERERAERQARTAAGQPVDTGQIVDREAFLDSAWRHNTKPDGTVFGIPQILDADCLVWNLDLLQKAAETDPEVRGMFRHGPGGEVDYTRLRFDAVRDWAQFRRVVRKLSRFGKDGRLAVDGQGKELQAGFVIHGHGSGAAPFLPWCAANGSNFQDPEGTRALFADEAGVETMRFLGDLYWKDHVCPTFRQQMTDDEVFNQRHLVCLAAGTYSGKYITRNTEGWTHFDNTPFPPGPHGSGQTTLTWGNMLVISRRSTEPELAWEYVKFITGKEGALRLLRHIEQNSPRKDFYETPDWRRMCERYPYLWNVPGICASGKKLRHTQINAVDYVTRPVFETLLLEYPEIESGHGPYPSVAAGLRGAAEAADRVYDRYNAQIAYWREHQLAHR